MMYIALIKKAAIYVLIASALLSIGLYVYGGRIEEKQPEYSTYNSKPSGTRALYLLMEKLDFNVSRFERPSRFLPDDAALVAIKPDTAIFNNSIEMKYLKAWLEKGNTLILADDAAALKDYKLEALGLKHIEGSGDKGALDEYRIGSGKFIFVEGVDRFTNKGLKEIDPAVDFVGTVDSIGNRSVMFNEYYHGFGSRSVSLWDLLGQAGILAVIQAIIALAVFMFIRSRRFGKPVVVMEIVKRRENENLFAMAGIYAKSKTHSLVLETYLNYFKKQLSKYLGFSGVPEESKLMIAVSENKLLEALELRKTLNYSSSYLHSGSRDNKKLLDIILSLEKVRKEIN